MTSGFTRAQNAPEQVQTAGGPPEGKKRTAILIGILLATFLAAIEGTVTGPAGPAIVGEFQGMSWMSWIFTAYLLTMAVTTPIFGKMGDLFGRKPVFLGGVALFLLGSLLCGLSQNMTQLIAFRAVQGVGAGALIPMTFTIIGDIYSLKERAKTQGLLSSVWGVSSLAGPLLGGYVVDSFSWRWVFTFNLPFGLVAAAIIAVCLKEQPAKRKPSIDYAGAVLFALGIGALLFGLSAGGQSLPWNSPLLIGLLAGPLALIAAFILVERKVAEPILPLKLFTIRNIAVSTGTNLLVSALIIGLSTYVPLWIQGVEGGSAALSGLVIAPLSVCWIFGSYGGGKMLLTAGTRRTVAVGLALVSVGLAWLAGFEPHGSRVMLLTAMAVCGLGFGCVSTVFTIIAQSSVDFRQRGASTALNTFTRSLGQTLGVAVFGLWLNLSLSRSLAGSGEGAGQADINALLDPHQGAAALPAGAGEGLRTALADGLHGLFVALACIAIAALAISFTLRREAPSIEDAQTQSGLSTERRPAEGA